jgi:hypothetical protein
MASAYQDTFQSLTRFRRIGYEERDTHQRGMGIRTFSTKPIFSLFPPKKEVTDQRDKKFRLTARNVKHGKRSSENFWSLGS